MNKTTASILASLVALLTGLASLDVTGVLPLLGQFLPESVVKIIAVVPTLAAGILYAIVAAKRKLDADSKEFLDRYFKGPYPVILVMAAAACMLLPSCMIAFDPSTGRFGVHTDPQTVTEIVERITDRFNEDLQEAPPLVVPAK